MACLRAAPVSTPLRSGAYGAASRDAAALDSQSRDARLLPAQAACHLRLGLALLLLLAGPACTRHESDGTGQVVARVNGSEITVHQLNFLMANPEPPVPESGASPGAATPKDALDRLVDQELLVQAAKAKDLDRQPDVLAAMEAARRSVLARAFLEQVDAGAVQPGAADIHAYFAANPALFAQRRVYTLREIRVSAEGNAVDLQAVWERTHSWDALRSAVRATGALQEGGTRVVAAEQLPLEAVPAFQRLREGDVRFTRLADGALAQQVVHIAQEPMSEAAAAPLISAYLLAQRRRDAERDALAALKASARIERIGDFAADAPPTPAQGTGQ